MNINGCRFYYSIYKKCIRNKYINHNRSIKSNKVLTLEHYDFNIWGQ